jgi:Cdc6-like AAA superfamily ATPase
MTTTRKLTDLFRAIGSNNIEKASDVAASICDLEEKKGHTTAARALRGALKGNSLITARAEPGQQMFVSGGLTRLPPSRPISEVTLTASTRSAVAGVCQEWTHRAALLDRGISPRSKLLFHGPPGCGKSLTARAIGRELNLPVYLVRFDAVIGAFLGQTAMHLRQLFHFAETSPCILLLDELDALGKKRGNPLDVGELDRIVISLLQELEHSSPMGLVIATTNLAKNLDDALWRRFDLDVPFAAPTKPSLKAFAIQVGKRHGVHLNQGALARSTRAPSYSMAERAVLDEVRRLVVKKAQVK